MEQDAIVDIERCKGLLLDVLEVFIAFCHEYQLRWWVCGGTAIGAVRHRGFIPWDDDIDVYMPREDYERFLSLKEQISGGKYDNYEIIHPKAEGYYVPFAKFADRRTTIWEYAQLPFIMGIYIDVFPLDSIQLGNLQHIELANNYKLCIDHRARSLHDYRVSDYISMFKQMGAKPTFSMLWDVLYHHRKRADYQKCLKELEECLTEVEGDYYYCYGLNLYSEHECFHKSYFDGYVECPFEHLTVRMPKGYEAYLYSQFGDYMQLPSEDKRVSHHARFYVNLDKRLSLKEVRVLKKRL